MPIRFRCAYCNQLMGISRKKAGAVIRCPKCAGQVIVPHPVPENAAGPAVPNPGPAAAAGPALFEGSDIEQLFGTQPAPPSPPAVNPIPYEHPQPIFSAEPKSVVPAPGPGIFVTPTKLTIASIVVVVLLGLAFFLGLLVGRS